MGGGIFAADGSRLSLVNSTLSGNYSYFSGAGVATGKNVTLKVESCVLSGNTAYSGGGGALSIHESSAVVTRSSIHDNRSETGGAGISLVKSNLSLSDSTVANNSGVWEFDDIHPGGSGLEIQGQSTASVSNSTITGNMFRNFLRRPGRRHSGGLHEPARHRQQHRRREQHAIRLQVRSRPTSPAPSGKATVTTSSAATSKARRRRPQERAVGKPLRRGRPRHRRRSAQPQGHRAAEERRYQSRSVRRRPDHRRLLRPARHHQRPLPAGSLPDIGSIEINQPLSTSPTANNDVITGSNAANNLAGLAGNDLIQGLAGADTLNGHDGSDVLDGGPGNDKLNGGNGVDIATFAGTTAVVVDLSTNPATAKRGSETDTLTSIEGAIGSDKADSFKGDGQDNEFLGGLGKDSCTGGGGRDLYAFKTVQDSPAGSGRDVIKDFVPGQDVHRRQRHRRRQHRPRPADLPLGRQGHADRGGAARLLCLWWQHDRPCEHRCRWQGRAGDPAQWQQDADRGRFPVLGGRRFGHEMGSIGGAFPRSGTALATGAAQRTALPISCWICGWW